MDKRYTDLHNKLRQEAPLPESYSWDNIGDNILEKVEVSSAVAKLSILKYMSVAIIVVASAVIYFNTNNTFKSQDQASVSAIKSTNVENQEQEKIIVNSSSIDNFQSEDTRVISVTTDVTSQTHETSLTAPSLDTKNQFQETSSKKAQITELKKVKESKQSSELKPEGKIESNTSSNVGKRVQDKEKRNSIASAPYSKKGTGIASTNLKAKNQDLENRSTSLSSIVKNQEATNNLDPLINEFSTTAGSYIGESSVENIENFQQLGAKEIPHLTLTDRQFSPAKINASTYIEIKPKKKLSKWSVEFGAGATGWISNLVGEELITNNRKIELIGLPSYGLGMQLSYEFAPSWMLSVGLGYGAYKNRLEYYDSRDTITAENVITRIEKNILTGEDEEVYEYLSLPGLAWDRVIHTNKYQYIDIPLSITKQVDINNKFTASIGIGLNYSRLLSKSGKGLDVEDSDHSKYKVIELANKNLVQSSIGFMLKADLNYILSEKTYVGISVSTQYSSKDIEPLEELSFRPIRFASMVKLGLRF